jgi:hypothetical protein
MVYMSKNHYYRYCVRPKIIIVSVVGTRPDQLVGGRDATEGRASGPKDEGSSWAQHQHKF